MPKNNFHKTLPNLNQVDSIFLQFRAHIGSTGLGSVTGY